MASGKSKTAKKDLIGRVVTLGLLFLALVFAVVYIVSLNSSFSWFATDGGVTADGMETTLSTETYEILVDRTTEFDTTLAGGAEKYEFTSDFKTKISSEEYGYSLSANSTGQGAIAYELVNESTYNDGETAYRFLMPGSYGTMTFYIRPTVDYDIVVNMNLSLSCFKKVYDENEGYVIEEEDNQTVLDLLKGHVLFFEDRSGNDTEDFIYSGLLDTGSLTYNTAEHEKCSEQGKTDCYKVTLYWEWPLLYSDMSQNIGQTTGRGKYPPELSTYINQNRRYFFIINQNSSNPEELEDGYNDADQTIGEHANFIVAYMSFK